MFFRPAQVLQLGLVAALAGTGCPANLTPFGPGNGGDDSVDDGGTQTHPGLEGGTPTQDAAAGKDGPAQVSLACARPYVLVGEADASQSHGGRIDRIELHSDGTWKACAPLVGASGGSGLMQSINAIAFFPPSYVMIAGADAAALIDADHDSLVWTASIPTTTGESQALDIVPTVNLAGALGIVGFGAQDGVTDVFGWDVNGALVDSWTASGAKPTFPSGSFGYTSIAMHPTMPTTHVLGIDPNEAAAQDIDLTTGTQSSTPFAPVPTVGVGLQSIYTILVGSGFRTVWYGDLSAGGDAVFQITHAGQTPLGPFQPADRTCGMHHAVPDPTDATAFIAICISGSESVADVIRFRTTDSAGAKSDVLFAGLALPSFAAPERLAVAQ